MKLKSLFLVLLISLSVAAVHGADVGAYGKIPLSFETNVGQAGHNVKFLSRGPGYGVFLTEQEAVLHLMKPAPAEIRIRLLGQSPRPRIEGVDLLPGKTHYLRGSNPAAWHEDAPNYARVRYSGVYPGIDVIYYGNQRQLEYDFVIAPRARPGSIQFRFDGIDGMEIGKDGALVLKTSAGEIREEKPLIYQESGGRRIPIEGGYVLRGRRTVGFKVASYDSTKPLIIDPTLVYASYFGGNGTSELGNAIAVDAAGNAYITGQTTSTNLFISQGVQKTAGGEADGFILKLDPTGTTVLYSTYFGGSANDEGHSIAIDAGGNAYVAGYTSSTDFPVVNGVQKTRAGGQDAYVLKLNSAGNAFIFSTYLGGSGDDRAFGVAVDSGGNAWVAGATSSTNFPTASPLQRVNAGGLNDVFVSKLGPAGNLIYSTYLGGIGIDQAYSIALDGIGNAYVAGYTTSINFPVVNAFQSGYNGGSDDGFLFKLNAAGTALEYSTYLGGTGSDNAVRVAVDGGGSAYVTGYTSSANYPTLNAYQTAHNGAFDAFITRLAPDGKSVVFSTYYGGLDLDSGTGIALDRGGNIYVAGYTTSFDLPTVNVIQDRIHGDRDAYVLKLNPEGNVIVYATYLGGLAADAAVGLAVDALGNAYITGLVNSTDFPLANPFQPETAGGQDAFVAKINSADVVTSSQFTIASQGGASFETRGTRSDLIFGYATAEPSSPGPPLTGLAILGFRRLGATGTEVGVLSPSLIEVGRMFVEVTTAVNSVISIVNPNDQDATVDFFFTDESGAQTHFATVTVGAHAHFSRFVGDQPLLIDSAGTLNFTSSIPIAAAGFRTVNNESGEFLISPTPIANPLVVSKEPVVIPEFSDGAAWNSEVVLVNTTENQMHGEIHFISQGNAAEPGTPIEVGIGDGSTSTSVLEYDIPPRSDQRFVTAGNATRSDFPFSARGGFTFKTPGTSTVQFSGYAAAETSTTNNPINGLELIEFRQNGITTGAAGLLAGPLRQTGRLFVEGVGQVRSLIAIANPSDQDVTVDFTFTDETGNTNGPVSVAVAAGGQFSSFTGDDPLKTLTVSTGGLTFTSSIPVSVAAFRFLTNGDNQSVISTIPIGDRSHVSNQPVVIPQFADGAGWTSQIVLVNTTETRMNGEVRFFSQGSGAQSGGPIAVGIGDGTASVLEYDIPPGSSQRFETAGVAESVAMGSIYVVPFGGFNTPFAHALLSLRNGAVIVSQTAIEGQLPGRNFRLYAEAFGDFGGSKPRSTRTAFAFANPANTSATVRLDLTSLDGTSLGSASIQIPANGQVAMFLNGVPGFETIKVPFQGILRATVTSGTGVTAVGMRAMFNESGNFLAATTGPLNENANSPTRLLFPYIADSSGYTSQFILVGDSTGQNVSGVLRFLGPDATPLGLDNRIVGSVQVVPFAGNDTPHAHVILSHREDGTTRFQTDVEGQQPARSFRLYAEAAGDFDAGLPGSTRTSLALANPSATPVTVRLDLTSFDGRSLGTSGSLQIPANGEVALFLNQVPGFENLAAPFQGVLRVTPTSGPGIMAVGFRAAYNENRNLLVTTTGPLNENAGSASLLVFPHIAEGGGYTSRLIVVSGSSGQSNSGILRFFGESGQPLNLTLTGQ